MAKSFSLDDAADFQANLDEYAQRLTQLDPVLGPELAKTLKGDADRDATLDALLVALEKGQAK